MTVSQETNDIPVEMHQKETSHKFMVDPPKDGRLVTWVEDGRSTPSTKKKYTQNLVQRKNKHTDRRKDGRSFMIVAISFQIRF